MDDRQAFLDALKKNEDDVATRMIYADWLEENGEDDEAERQRKWPAAKRWLQDFRRSINREGGEWDEESDKWLGNGTYELPHSYADIIEAGHLLAAGEFYCFKTDRGADFFREDESNVEKFLLNWSIVTGIPVPDKVFEEPNIGCAC